MADNIHYPGQLTIIPGTNLACMTSPFAVNRVNGIVRHNNFITNAPHKTRGTLREYCSKIYKLGNQTLDELKVSINKNEAVMLGDTYFEAVNQGYELDKNGNLCLKTYGSDLDGFMQDWYDFMLTKEGRIRQTHGSMIFQAPDKYGNYLALCFVSKRKPLSDEIYTYRIDYNFLNNLGSKITQSNFQSSSEPLIIDVPRTYSYNVNGEKPFIDNSHTILPQGYIYDNGQDFMVPSENPSRFIYDNFINNDNLPKFFPSATALLIENRTRIMNGQTPYVQDETPYIVEHYKRQNEFPSIQRKLTLKFQQGRISYPAYRHAMQTLDKEFAIAGIFNEQFATSDDEAIYYDSLEDDFVQE